MTLIKDVSRELKTLNFKPGTVNANRMNLQILPHELAVCRLAPDADLPAIDHLPFFSITRTDDELSIVLPESAADPGWEIEAGWRVLKVEGPLDFGMVGVIARISAPLAEARVPIFVISTFDTDYLLVKAEKLARTKEVLERAEFRVSNAE